MAAWNVLFYNPDFWDFVHHKRHFCHLREVCREFRSTIPEREALLRIFKNKVAKKVDLFRLLPLSVNDVLRIKSPVDFVEAFKIAEKKSGGFANCMAIVRERGWMLWLKTGALREEIRNHIDERFRSEGLNPPLDDPAYVMAIQRFVQRVVVWRYTCTIEGLLPWEKYNPEARGNSRIVSALLHRPYEYDLLLKTLRQAVGYWYRGINKDVRSAVVAIRSIRSSISDQTDCIHLSVSRGVLMVGVIKFVRWTPQLI